MPGPHIHSTAVGRQGKNIKGFVHHRCASREGEFQGQVHRCRPSVDGHAFAGHHAGAASASSSAPIYGPAFPHASTRRYYRNPAW